MGKKPIIISIAVFFIYLSICALVGILNQNRIDVLQKDIFGFAWLFLIPVAMVTIKDGPHFEFIQKCIIWGALIQAILIIGINIVCLVQNELNKPINQILISTQIGNIDYITTNLFRIFTKSSSYLIVGIIFATYKQVCSKKFIWVYAISAGVCLCALMLTYTRSIYGAAFITIGFTIILHFISVKGKRIKLFQHVVIFMLVAVILTMAQQVASGKSYFQFAVNRVFSIDFVKEEVAEEKDINDSVSGEKETVETVNISDHLYNTNNEGAIPQILNQISNNILLTQKTQMIYATPPYKSCVT